jgi:hypothetical protein
MVNGAIWGRKVKKSRTIINKGKGERRKWKGEDNRFDV